MTVRDLWNVAVTDAAPQVIFIIGLLWVIYRLGTLWITKHFEKLVPVHERQAKAVEYLSETAADLAKTVDKLADHWDRDHNALYSAIRAAHARLETIEGQT